jgi:hypothetical protein
LTPFVGDFAQIMESSVDLDALLEKAGSVDFEGLSPSKAIVRHTSLDLNRDRPQTVGAIIRPSLVNHSPVVRTSIAHHLPIIRRSFATHSPIICQ